MKKKKDKATLKQGLFVIGVLVLFISVGLIFQGLYNFITEPKFVITKGGEFVDEGELYCFWQKIEDCDYGGKLGLNVEWLDLHCEILSGDCRYVRKRDIINSSKEYISNTIETPNCLDIEECYDFICEGTTEYQCGNFSVEVRR